MTQTAETKVGDRPPTDVGDAHPEQQRIDKRADDDVAPVRPFGRGKVGIGVQWAHGHGHQAELMVFGLGDRLAGPVPKDVAFLVVLEVSAESSIASIKDAGHGALRSLRVGSCIGRNSFMLVRHSKRRWALRSTVRSPLRR